MNKEEIVKYAKQGRLPETALTCPERALFYTLKDVYDQFKAKKITAQQGETFKNQAMRQFELDKGAFDSAMMILRSNAELWKSIEYEGNQYRLNRTLENADTFIEAVYQVKMKRQEGSDNN